LVPVGISAPPRRRHRSPPPKPLRPKIMPLDTKPSSRPDGRAF
jgi:hypothetical protein